MVTGGVTHIYFVRHCEAQGNIERFFQGHTDGAVSDNGQAQCEALAARFKEIPLEAVYASPLSRAHFTAEAIARSHGLAVRAEPGLIELNGGRWEGERWVDLPALFPKEAETWANRPWEFAPAGGESMADVYHRIVKTAHMLAQRHPGQTIAAVSHGCAIRNLLTYVRYGTIDRLGDTKWCDNTAVNLLAFDAQGSVQIVFENDAAHLDQNLSTLAKQSWWRDDSDSKFE